MVRDDHYLIVTAGIELAAKRTDTRTERGETIDDVCGATLVLGPGCAGDGADDGAVPLVLVAHASGPAVRVGAVWAGRSRRLYGVAAAGSGRQLLPAQPVHYRPPGRAALQPVLLGARPTRALPGRLAGA